MSRRGFTLLEGVVALFVALTAGLALMSMLVSLVRLQRVSSHDRVAQDVLETALTQVMVSTTPTLQGDKTVDGVTYRWRGQVEKKPPQRIASAAVEWDGHSISGRRSELP